jgi:hypothetical protein
VTLLDRLSIAFETLSNKQHYAMSAIGTFLPCQPRRAMSAFGRRPADICSMRVLRILTLTGPRILQAARNPVAECVWHTR